MTVLEVKNLKKIYRTRFGGTQVQALSCVNFSVEEGEYVAIMGESGSGKTTLLNMLAALDKPTEGEVYLDGKPLSAIKDKNLSEFRRDNLGFVFQEFNLLDTFNVKDNILLPLVLKGETYKEMTKKLMPIAKELGMKDDHVFVCENGDMLELYKHQVRRTGAHISADDVYIDGNDLDGISGNILSDRDVMKNDGLITVILTIGKDKGLLVAPIVYARGFSASEQTHVVRHAQMKAEEETRNIVEGGNYEFAELKQAIKNVVAKYVERKTGRRPMILVAVMSEDE